ncbi:hypothetical protein DFH29DRAFT_959385 [Suillus ampliporus]|nr:hypothetical protein DFH29DRAFT_959385 [Suillus ampliporus]
MGVDVSTFSSLLTAGFAQAWYEMPIPRDDVSTHGNPRINQRSLDAAGVLKKSKVPGLVTVQREHAKPKWSSYEHAEDLEENFVDRG